MNILSKNKRESIANIIGNTNGNNNGNNEHPTFGERLGIFAQFITTIGDLLALVSAGILIEEGLDEAKKEEKEKKSQEQQLEKMQSQIESLQKEITLLKKAKGDNTM